MTTDTPADDALRRAIPQAEMDNFGSPEQCLQADAETVVRNFGARPGVNTYRENCALDVARAWLREHPADDEQPVTEEWLKACGFSPVDPDDLYGWLTYGMLEVAPDRDNPDSTDVKYAEEYMPAECRFGTRGKIRQLCRLLSIPLTEGTL